MNLITFVLSGKFICILQGVIGNVCFPVELSVVVGISLYRAYALSRTLASRHLSPSTIHKAVIGFFIFSVLCTLGGIAIGQYYAFDPYLLSCKLHGLTDPNPLFAIGTITIVVMFFFVPVVGIISANLAILVLVARARGGVPGINAVRTVSCVSWAFVISVIPMVVRGLLQVNSVPIPPWFYVAGHELLFMNVVVNPIIYTATNRGFRTFLTNLIRRNRN